LRYTLIFADDIPAGARITEQSVTAKEVNANSVSPGYVTSSDLRNVIGRKLLFPGRKGQALFWADVRNGD
jgi:flagella basal body P-ring formation protein FlgA